MSAVEVTQQEAQFPALPEVQVKFTPAVIEVNFDDLKAALSAQVEEQSNTVVTADNLAACKKLMADMNKTGGAIKAARIDYAKKAGVNIATFEAAMKELEAISAAGVAKIKEQAARFEAETLEAIKALLSATLLQEWDALNVSAEFRTAHINDLVLLGSVTGTGKLTGKVANDIKSRALDNKSAENAIKMRLLELENQSFKSGLKAALTRDHVAAFLFAPEDVYQQRLAAMLQSEVQRQEQTEAKLIAQMAKEQKHVKQAEDFAKECEALQPVEQPVEQQRTAAPTGIKFAYAPLNDPRAASFIVGSLNEAVQHANYNLSGEQLGIWTKADGLVAIIHEGDAFYRNVAA